MPLTQNFINPETQALVRRLDWQLSTYTRGWSSLCCRCQHGFYYQLVTGRIHSKLPLVGIVIGLSVGLGASFQLQR